MPFIGIISKENDSNFIKNTITKNSKTNKFEIVNINKKSKENIKNIKFDEIKKDIDNYKGYKGDIDNSDVGKSKLFRQTK